ncbi:MAG: hypothetical protein HOL04_04230 [Gammaproteobacteria bacterium]|nr:hypothetical protein [Gammaproteobacteria bacterium]MBT4608230.1 hypothetical protein [Thiotrichales bacterium]MBT3471273.1 hypothetical protein [Gammaproteobacteria bacterium]MBT3966060.1 hypothetical protein [Gammaproteobacteria bacterium]MBT4080033.1 hypothetical protein [Gammaproteobacteria bacterium]
MSRIVKLSLLLLSLSLLSGAYFSYTLFLEAALLKGAHNTLQQRHKRTQQALKKSKQALKQTQKSLKSSQQKLAKIESNRPKGVRKLATKASKIPLIGTIASVGLIAADAVEAATECYQEQTQCKEDLETLYQEGRELISSEE